MIQKIEYLAQEPQIGFENDILTIQGILVGTGDVCSAINKFPNPKIINIFSLNTFFIDEGFKSPASSLNFIAPHVKVMRDRMHTSIPHLKFQGERAITLTANDDPHTTGSVYGKASIGESLSQCTFYISGKEEGKLGSEVIQIDNPNDTICPYLMQNLAQGLTPLEIQSSVQQLPLDSGPFTQEYNHYYFQQAMNPQIAPFIKTFSRPQQEWGPSEGGGGASGLHLSPKSVTGDDTSSKEDGGGGASGLSLEINPENKPSEGGGGASGL